LTQIETGVEVFAVAPDGGTIAYVSEGQLWLLPPTEPTATAITEVTDVETVAFNPEGTEITYDTPEGIFTISPDGGEPEPLLNGYSDPAYTSDPDRMFVRIADGDAAFYDRATGDVRRLGAFDETRLLNDGRIAAGGAPILDNTSGLYLIDPANDFTPELVYPAPDGLRIEAMVEVRPGEVRLVMGSDAFGPAPLRIVDLPVAGGDPLPLPGPGFMAQPQLSPDGRFIAGYTSAVRSLAIYDLNTTQELLLKQPPSVNTFHWE
jgi:hypothetical protein